MPTLEQCLLALLGLGVTLASCSLLVGRAARRRQMLLATLLVLGGSALFAAVHQAEMLVYLGLASGSLVVLMLWDSPRTRWIPEEW